ncbi:hypothetical protein AGMMS49579_22820 [Spirochaetia bacterium]|nr:hypothetical protein AGMMS49579_22820 [Spirochaetia bacterium]
MSTYTEIMKINFSVQNGIDTLITEDFGLKGKRLGLITTVTGLSASLVSSIDILRERFNLTALFAPEHGVRGDVDAGGDVATYTDPRTGLTVYSLYGGDNRPAPAMLENIDMLLIDIQDIGCRFFTFISTMFNAMEECARAGKTFVALDRFNPINGLGVEGNILDIRFKSFVGIAPIPQRHGLTMGERPSDHQALESDINAIPRVQKSTRLNSSHLQLSRMPSSA